MRSPGSSHVAARSSARPVVQPFRAARRARPRPAGARHPSAGRLRRDRGRGDDGRHARRCPDVPVVGVPKTIDNDIGGTDHSVGFQTAVQIATELIDRLYSTAESHHRVMVCEVMGRSAGWIGLTAGIAGSADVILRPGAPVRHRARRPADRAASSRASPVLDRRRQRGRGPVAGTMEVPDYPLDPNGWPRLGGIGGLVARPSWRGEPAYESRITVLGHVQRGGSPVRVRPGARRRGSGIAAVDEAASGRMGHGSWAWRGQRRRRRPRSPRWARRHVSVPDDAGGCRRSSATEAVRSTGAGRRARRRLRPMRMGILTGGGDVPGLNASIKAVVMRAASEGHEVVGIRRGWGGLLELEPDDPATIASEHRAARSRGGPDDRPHRRHVPAHVAHESGEGQRRRTSPRSWRRAARTTARGTTRHTRSGDRASRARRPDPDRRRRHALVRPAAAPGGRPGHRDPEDDGQRRARHRLLHRVLDGGHAHGQLRASAAHERRVARTARGRRGLRPLQRRDVARRRRTWPASTGRSSPRCRSTSTGWPRS